ncbi:MAG: PH domain-containing protein [Gemmatimonadaceae bacterium]
MPSEHRLHPLSILFSFGALIRNFALPWVLLLVTARSADWDWYVWTLLFVAPNALVSISRYVSFRYSYDEKEMVIRSGILFRNERHVPYARIQNLDAVQNMMHRLLKVVEVRVETGAGQRPEATMSVLPVSALEEMRRRVFEEREQVVRAPDEVEATAVPVAKSPTQGRILLHLPSRELILHGLIQNRGVVVIAAAFGVLWELGLVDASMDRLAGDQASGRGVARDFVRAMFGQGGLPVSRILLTLAAFVGLLLFIRLISMTWALVRLHGFKLIRVGEDLRTEFGLLTRVVATIPVRRIQTLTIMEGPLHQLSGRVSVRVDTAGGDGASDTATQREWLAPILRRHELPSLLHDVLPEVDLARIQWQAVHPYAFRRAVKEWIVIAVLISLPFVLLLKWWNLALLALLLVWAFVVARLNISRLGWATTEGVVMHRSGWAWRKLSVARLAKIQAVAIHESPFDRRTGMADLRVDTAGAGDASHRVHIPYLPRETARGLCDVLATQAGRTAFKW